MAAGGISSTGLLSYGDALSEAQKLQADFQQLGKDLQAGSLSAAQSDVAALNQDAATFTPSAGAQGNSPIDQEFQKLAQDLQGGNLSGAQQDYAAIQQDLKGGGAPAPPTPGTVTATAGGPAALGPTASGVPSQSDAPQNHGTPLHGHHHGHHHGGGDEGGSGAGDISQLMGQLGQALQSGNLSAAQQAYNSLSQDWNQNGDGGPNGTGSAQPTPAPATQTGTNSVSESLFFVAVNISVTA